MAIAASDKLLILKFLGYSPTPEYRQLLDQRLAYTVGADIDLENLVKDEIRELIKIQDDINGARLGAGRSFQSGGASTVQLYRGDRLNELRQHARQHVNYLVDATGMIVNRDVFMGGSVRVGSGQVIRG